MFEIFLAFFGGLFYGTKILGEKSAHKAAEIERNRKKLTRDEWVESVTNRELEQELRLFISKPENRKEVLKETDPIYDTVLKDTAFDDIYPRWRWPSGKKYTKDYMEHIARYNHDYALRIMMAKRGYITSYEAVCGASHMLSFYTEFHKRVFLQCVEELKKHGVTQRFSQSDVDRIPNDTLSKWGWEIS